MKTRCSFLTCAFGLGLALAVLWIAIARPQPARAGILCVAPGGASGCHPSIQEAIGAANNGDTIRVAQGTYFETVVLSKSLTLEGGWNVDFTSRDWDTNITTIDAQRNDSVIRVSAGVTVTIEGFVITGGDASSYLGWGGGILMDGDTLNPGLATIRHNVITNNVACNGSVSCQGYGGGIMVYGSQSIIEDNTIISNTARTGGNGSGQGGGIAILGYPSDSTITGNVIISNTAVFSTTGPFAVGEGGGVFLYGSDVTLRNNEIRGNVAAGKGSGYGGGVYATGYLYDNVIVGNVASLDGPGQGGGVYADWVQDFSNNQVQDNVASKYGDGLGGGVYANQLQFAWKNTFVNNTATRGGGVYLGTISRTELRDNLITGNHAASTLVPGQGGGGGIASLDDQAKILGNQILSNTALFQGGGILVLGGNNYLVQDNQIEDNFGALGGGITVYTATGEIVDNWLISNTAWAGGGMLLWGKASPAIDRNLVISNTASGYAGEAGGGILVMVNDGVTVAISDSIIARNSADGRGGGVNCYRGNCKLVNCTIVDNNRGANKEGVILGSSFGGNFWLRNNIIAGHSVGVQRNSGTADLDYNDYFDNATNVNGASMGTHSITDDPTFEDRALGDYHLMLDSPLIDKGTGGVIAPFDIDGDPRPHGAGMDIGADETYRAESYVSDRIGNDITGDGSSGGPFATVTKGINETSVGGTVHVGQGTYTECITVTHSINLLGGYDETNWSRDIGTHETILDAQGAGTVVVIHGESVQALVEGFTITGGEASMWGSGGGIAVYDDAAVTIRHNTITGNHAQNGGGGILLWGNEYVESVIDSNYIYNNVADGVFPFPGIVSCPEQGPEPGGGLLAGSPARIVNNMIYHNTAAAGGDGLAISYSEGIKVFHNTVADNGGSDGAGIQIFGTGKQVQLYDNLIVGHGTGISATTSSQATWNYNGFYDNEASYAMGLISGPNDVSGEPFFIDRSYDNYHIGAASAAANAGLDVGVTIDIDGEARPAPSGTLPDLGADEVNQLLVYLPLVWK